MTPDEAWWILRAEIELADEGIGVGQHTSKTTGDSAILGEAFRLAGDKIPEYDRWVFKDEHREEPIRKAD